jgi:hypothetical protein
MSLQNKKITKREFIKTLGILGVFFSFGGFLSLFNSKQEPKSGFGKGGYGA